MLDPESQRAALESEMGEPITIDGLTGAWSILQRKKGHRHSIDDVLTAHYALHTITTHRLDVPRFLDLGTGIGTVGLMVLSRLAPDATMFGVEAQAISYRLLQANIAINELSSRVTTQLGDLRELALDEKFPLITGSPPYFPITAGVVPQDSQKAHARFELRGDIADYARAAMRHLSPDGWFVCCFPAPQRARALTSLTDAGFAVRHMRDVIPRETLPELFSLFACNRRDSSSPAMIGDPPLVVRHENGALTDEMAAVRRGFGFADYAPR